MLLLISDMPVLQDGNAILFCLWIGWHTATAWIDVHVDILT